MKTKDWFCSFGLLRLRRQSTALLLVNLYLSTLTAHAQNTVWRGTATSTDWNTPTNWSTGIVPTGQANFGSSGGRLVTFSLNTSVGTLQFNAPGYVFDVDIFGRPLLTITGGGVSSTPTNAPTFNVTSLGNPAFVFESGTAGPAIFNVTNTADMEFHGTSTAGQAKITTGITVPPGNPEGFDGGFLKFFDHSTAGTATITNLFGSNTEFHGSSSADHATITSDFIGFTFFNETSTAGNATLITNDGGQTVFGHNDGGEFLGGTPTAGDATIITNSGGETLFENEGSGGNARFITNAGGTVDISALTTGGTTAGSIEGAGTYKLGSKMFTVGSNNLDTVVSGLVEDGGQAGGVGGSLVKVGAGTLTLLGDNTYSGGTTIEKGIIEVGTLVAADQPISTALGTGNVFVNGGTLRTTSASTGVPLIINVGGNYTQGAGGTLVLGIGGTQGEQYDHVQVNGSATLGGTLVVNSLGGFHPANLNLFEVLTATKGRSGEFATVTDNINIDPNLRRVDIYAPNGAALLYIAEAAPTPTPPTPGPSPTPSPAPSPTPVPPKPPIIDVIPDPLPPVNPDAPLPPSFLSFLLAALNPTAEQLTSMFEIPFSGANTQRFNLNDRMTQIRRGSTGFVSGVPPAPPPAPTGKEIGKKEVVPPAFVPGPTNRWGVWVNGWGDWVNVNDDNGIKGYDFTTGGVSVGVDYRITDYLAVGIFGTYAHTWTSLNPGSVDVNTGRGGLYATYWNQGFYINGAVYGGGNSYDTSRHELTNTSANGSTSGYEISTFVDTGYDFRFGDLSFGPIFAAQYTNVHIDGFTERGSFLPLNIHNDSEESWRTDLGVQASYPWHVGNIIVIPSLWAAWEHEYKYSRLPITFSSPVFGGVSATAFGPHEGHDSAIINAGVGTQWTPRIATYVGYQGQLGRDNYDANGVTGTISFSF